VSVVALAEFFDMAAERSGTANFDRARHAQLLKRQLVPLAVSRAVSSKISASSKAGRGKAQGLRRVRGGSGLFNRSSGLIVRPTT
jgi:hypothetical protein